jgi:diguanylate cyclase (GGDEF)-like protein
VVVVQEEKLTAVLSEFARTLATDFPIQGILDHLVDRIVEILPITAAGVTLISAGEAPHYIAASDESALRFEQLQTSIGEGPCLLAYQSGAAVSIPDLRHDARFPQFAPAASEAGLAAVFTFPLRHSDGRLGALDLYRDVPGELGEHDMAAAQTLADVTTAYLLMAQARDEARTTSEQFEYGALHDPLTGLANRLLLQERIEHVARRAKRSHTNAAILFIDLDRFKHVNDTYGHLAGDKLLIAVAGRLSALLRPGDTLARFSGDEFVLLCEDMRAGSDGEILARRVSTAFSEPFVLGDIVLTLTASVGIAFAGRGEDVSNRLLAQADMAMYQAKRKGGARHQTIDLRAAREAQAQNNLERDLQGARARDELEVAYQPIVRIADGEITGVEALLRWTHPRHGVVPAASIVALAEESDLISEIGAWVLERGCRDRQTWVREHPDTPLELAVNVSGRQLMSHDFRAGVSDIVARTGMDPTALILEVTESIYIEDSERTAKILSGLRDVGIRLALDDFGTGYSSLSYLRRLPIDIVKIDQGFVSDIDHGSDAKATSGCAVVTAVVNLAHAFKLTVVAEGVETQSQHDHVRDVGCESAQGYFYARPMPAAAIGDYLCELEHGKSRRPATPRDELATDNPERPAETPAPDVVTGHAASDVQASPKALLAHCAAEALDCVRGLSSSTHQKGCVE